MPRVSACRRSIGLILTLMALAMRLVVPAGFMLVPGTGTAALPTLVICDGAGPAMAPGMHAMADHRQGHSRNDKNNKNDQADHTCPFATAAAALDRAPPPLAPIFAPAAPVILAASLLHARPGLGLAAPPPPSRGPPPAI